MIEKSRSYEELTFQARNPDIADEDITETTHIAEANKVAWTMNIDLESRCEQGQDAGRLCLFDPYEDVSGQELIQRARRDVYPWRAPHCHA